MSSPARMKGAGIQPSGYTVPPQRRRYRRACWYRPASSARFVTTVSLRTSRAGHSNTAYRWFATRGGGFGGQRPRRPSRSARWHAPIRMPDAAARMRVGQTRATSVAPTRHHGPASPASTRRPAVPRWPVAAKAAHPRHGEGRHTKPLQQQRPAQCAVVLAVFSGVHDCRSPPRSSPRRHPPAARPAQRSGPMPVNHW